MARLIVEYFADKDLGGRNYSVTANAGGGTLGTTSGSDTMSAVSVNVLNGDPGYKGLTGD